MTLRLIQSEHDAQVAGKTQECRDLLCGMLAKVMELEGVKDDETKRWKARDLEAKAITLSVAFDELAKLTDTEG